MSKYVCLELVMHLFIVRCFKLFEVVSTIYNGRIGS